MMRTLALSFFIASSVLLGGCTEQEMDDSTLTAAVKGKLAVNADTSAIKISVQTTNGVVTLSGTVPTDQERSRAEEVTSKTDGVKRVVNQITVDPKSIGATNAEKKLEDTFERARKGTEKAAEKSGDAITDATILTTIQARLVADGVIGTNVEVTQGDVVLKGEVESALERATAESVAKDVTGVKSVKNLLTVKKARK